MIFRLNYQTKNSNASVCYLFINFFNGKIRIKHSCNILVLCKYIFIFLTIHWPWILYHFYFVMRDIKVLKFKFCACYLYMEYVCLYFLLFLRWYMINMSFYKRYSLKMFCMRYGQEFLHQYKSFYVLASQRDMSASFYYQLSLMSIKFHIAVIIWNVIYAYLHWSWKRKTTGKKKKVL